MMFLFVVPSTRSTYSPTETGAPEPTPLVNCDAGQTFPVLACADDEVNSATPTATSATIPTPTSTRLSARGLSRVPTGRYRAGRRSERRRLIVASGIQAARRRGRRRVDARVGRGGLLIGKLR